MITSGVHLAAQPCMGAPFLIASSSFAFKQIPLRLQADATAATSRCHCGYKQMPLRLQKDTPATTNRCHCGYKQIPLRRQADAAAATSRCHCGYKQKPLRLQANATAATHSKQNSIQSNIRQHSCPTSSHTLYSRSSSPRRMIPSDVSA